VPFPSYGRLFVEFSLSIEGCLTLTRPHWGWSPANIRINFTSPETRGIVLPDAENRTIVSSFVWTQYRMRCNKYWQWHTVSLALVRLIWRSWLWKIPLSVKWCKIMAVTWLEVIQCHHRKMYVTSYLTITLPYIMSHTVSKVAQRIGQILARHICLHFDFYLWPWKPFHQFSFTQWLFVAIFIKLPSLLREILHYTDQVTSFGVQSNSISCNI